MHLKCEFKIGFVEIYVFLSCFLRYFYINKKCKNIEEGYADMAYANMDNMNLGNAGNMNMSDMNKNLKKLLNADISEAAGTSFYCETCGKEHSVDIDKIILEKGAVNQISDT